MMYGYFAWVSATQIFLHMPHSHIFIREIWSSSGVYETVNVWNWDRIISRSNTRWRKNCDDTNMQRHFCLQSNTLVFMTGVFMVKQSCSTELQRNPLHEINAEVRSAILILTDSDCSQMIHCLHGAITWEEARQTLTGRELHADADLWPRRDATRHVSQSSSLAACCTAARAEAKGKRAHNCTCNSVWSCDTFQAIKKVAEEPKICKNTNNNNLKNGVSISG